VDVRFDTTTTTASTANSNKQCALNDRAEPADEVKLCIYTVAPNCGIFPFFSFVQRVCLMISHGYSWCSEWPYLEIQKQDSDCLTLHMFPLEKHQKVRVNCSADWYFQSISLIPHTFSVDAFPPPKDSLSSLYKRLIPLYTLCLPARRPVKIHAIPFHWTGPNRHCWLLWDARRHISEVNSGPLDHLFGTPENV
jgi:hypothetical protein